MGTPPTGRPCGDVEARPARAYPLLVTPELESQILTCRSLPSLPVAALEVLAASRQAQVDLHAMADTISRDPAMAARVVAASNAAAFGWGEVASLPRAVTLLGANRVLCVVLTFSLVSIRRRGEAHGFDHGAYWKRAIFAGIAARALAEMAGVDPDEALLAGLLQDFGCLALSEALRARYGQIVREARGNHWRLYDLEQEQLGATHVEVTVLLAERWHIPERLRLAAAGSHLVPSAPPGRLDLAACVALSGPFAEVWTAPSPADAVDDALSTGRAFGQSRETIGAVLARIGALVPEVAAELQVTVAPEEQRRRVLSEARAALARVKGRAGAQLPPEAEAVAGQPDGEEPDPP